VARYWSISAVPVSAHPPPLVITLKLAAAIYGGAANNKYKYSIQYCPCDCNYAVLCSLGRVQCFVVHVRCRRKESSRSLSHLMSFLFVYVYVQLKSGLHSDLQNVSLKAPQLQSRTPSRKWHWRRRKATAAVRGGGPERRTSCCNVLFAGGAGGRRAYLSRRRVLRLCATVATTALC